MFPSHLNKRIHVFGVSHFYSTDIRTTGVPDIKNHKHMGCASRTQKADHSIWKASIQPDDHNDRNGWGGRCASAHNRV